MGDNLQVFLRLGMISGSKSTRPWPASPSPRTWPACAAVRDDPRGGEREPGAQAPDIRRPGGAGLAGVHPGQQHSAISIGKIAQDWPVRPGSGSHFWNRPTWCLRGGDPRSPHRGRGGEAVFALLRRVGKKPVRVQKDVPGFVGNRMQHALWREAISLVEQGIASAEDVDEVVRYSFGLRLAFLAPWPPPTWPAWTSPTKCTRIYSPIWTAPWSPRPAHPKDRAGELGAKSGRGFIRGRLKTQAGGLPTRRGVAEDSAGGPGLANAGRPLGAPTQAPPGGGTRSWAWVKRRFSSCTVWPTPGCCSWSPRDSPGLRNDERAQLRPRLLYCWRLLRLSILRVTATSGWPWW